MFLMILVVNLVMKLKVQKKKKKKKVRVKENPYMISDLNGDKYANSVIPDVSLG